MEGMSLLDEPFEIRRGNTRTLSDLDCEAILSQSAAAFERAAEGASAREREALRRALGEFPPLRVAAQLRPAPYRRFVSERSPAPFRDLPPGHLRLRNISVIITTKCTLRCKHCGQLMNLYLHLDKKEFIRQMKRKLLRGNRALTACGHCSYTADGVPIPRAEQEERG